MTLHDTPPGELRMLANDYGLTIACHTFFADLSLSDQASRQAGIEAIKRGVEAAVLLGTDRVMIPTPGREGQPREETRRNYIAGLQGVADFALQAGITLTVENFPGAGSPFVIAADMLQLVREVPGMKITYDNGNVFTGGEDPAVLLCALRRSGGTCPFQGLAFHRAGRRCAGAGWPMLSRRAHRRRCC